MLRIIFSAFAGFILCLSATSSFGQGRVISNEEVRLLAIAEGALVAVQKTNNSKDLQTSIDSIRSIGADLVATAAIALRKAEAINARPETHLALMDLQRFGTTLLARAADDLGDAATIDKNTSTSAAIWEARNEVASALIVSGNVEAFALLPGDKDQVKLNPRSTSIAGLHDSTSIIALLPISILVLTALYVFIGNNTPAGINYRQNKHEKNVIDIIFKEHLKLMQNVANDLSVPDDVLLSMRAEARKLRRVPV
jgi:hypothetical protein